MSDSSPGSNPLEKRPPVYVFRIQTPKRSATIRLDGPFFVLGRGEPYKIFHDDPSLSREHLALVDTPAGYRVKDLGSRNGVLLNGRRLERYSEVPLELGDVLVAGQTTVRLLLQQEAALEAAAEAGEHVTVGAAGESTALSALPTRDEGDPLCGEATGALERPGLSELEAGMDSMDMEATQFGVDEDEGGLELDPEVTQVAMEEDDDLELVPDEAELALPADAVDALEYDSGGSVEDLAVEIDAASAGKAPRSSEEERASSAELSQLAAEIGASSDGVQADLDGPELE